MSYFIKRNSNFILFLNNLDNLFFNVIFANAKSHVKIIHNFTQLAYSIRTSFLNVFNFFTLNHIKLPQKIHYE